MFDAAAKPLLAFFARVFDLRALGARAIGGGRARLLHRGAQFSLARVESLADEGQ